MSRAAVAAAFLAATISLPAAAGEAGTVKIMAPWESSGELYRVGPQEVLFIGVGEGIMYIENGEGELDAAHLVCPGTREMNVESGEVMGHGRCIITAAEGRGQVFAEYRCKGKGGDCEGAFTLNGGTGEFDGITGEGPIFVRTSMAAMIGDMKNGMAISGAAGLAVWPELKFKIP